MKTQVAIVQFRAEAFDAGGNRRRTLDLVEEAAAAGARLVVLPELAISGYQLERAGLLRSAEEINGPTLEAWSGAARRHGVWIAGGFCERQGDRLFNSAMLVGPDGLAGHYQKLHLFDSEKLIFAPGERGLSVYQTPIGRIGICVCYDLRFVEVARVLALAGADLIAVPTAWVRGFDPKPRDAMGYIGQARGAILQANLNQVYIAIASQCGRVGTTEFLGSSLIADPYGTVLEGPMGDDEERIAVAEFDTAVAEASRVRSPLVRPREDRRTDVYAVASGGKQY
ncbi:MAG: hydratase [Aestuariivirga sp.]|nr:hydratase [Aestuariivirga sp.]